MQEVIIKRLIWEEWNIAHIARHNVVPEEVEEVCLADPYMSGAKKGRICAIGYTKKRRIIALFLDPEPEDGVYYPVSARDASKKERSVYNTWSKGGEIAT
jgi:Uncharacterized protein conserved in bacteria